jgi:hypothetical protein
MLFGVSFWVFGVWMFGSLINCAERAESEEKNGLEVAVLV